MKRRFIWRVVLLFSLVSVKQAEGFAMTKYASDDQKCQVAFGESYHNYLPGSLIRLDVNFKNPTERNLKVSQELIVTDRKGSRFWNTIINLELIPKGDATIPLIIPAPKVSGIFYLTTGDTASSKAEFFNSFKFNVIQPKKSLRLSKILVFSPDYEEDLNAFLKTWGIKAPMISWGQVLLCGKKSWIRYKEGDPEIIQIINRSLRREMSVIFLDFGSSGAREELQKKVVLPYDVSVSLINVRSAEKSFTLKPELKELNYGFTSGLMNEWNGLNGIVIPAEDLRFEGKEMKINAYATSGDNLIRFPVVELIPQRGKGKVYISQVITEDRIDEKIISVRNKPELPAYDPMAVQFLLNLISATVGDNLLK